jgi:hypothetical protein
MRKNLQGGVSPFAPTIRPNVFSPLGVEDLIDRQGESALWFRMQPCPCPQEDRKLDCHLCIDGQIRSFQPSILKEFEAMKADGHFLYARYAPILSVKRAIWQNEGVQQDLTVVRVEEDRIEIKENLKDWAAVTVDYEVSMVEQTIIETEIYNSMIIDLPNAGGVIVGVEYLYLDDTEIPYSGYRFQSIILPGRKTGKIRAKVKIMPPVKIAYRTMDIRTGKTEKAGLTGEAGEVEIIAPAGLMIGEGDYISFLKTEVRAAHYVPFIAGPIDILLYTPIVRVENIVSKKDGRIVNHREGEDFVTLSSEKILWLVDKPQGGFSIMYVYHPTFRIQPGFTGAGTMNRSQPRQYKARPASSFDIRGK